MGGLASVALSWLALSWWLTAAYVVVTAFLAFSAGAYYEWKDTSRLTGEALMVSFNATLRQLHGERGRANEWLRKLRTNRDDSEARAIETLIEISWFRGLQQLIEPRFPALWASFTDEADDLPPVAATDHERVFAIVQRLVKKLDAIIDQLQDTHDRIRDIAEI